MGQLVLAFDYSGVLPESRAKLMEAAEQVRRTARAGAYAIGKALIGVKNLLPNGEFLVWIDEECGISVRTAQKCMAVAEAFECANLALLDRIAISAQYELAAKGCPLEAKEACIQLANDGVFVSYSMARGLIGEHQPKQVESFVETPSKEAKAEKKAKADAAVSGAISTMQVLVEEVDDPEEVEEEYDEDNDDESFADEMEISFTEQFRRLWAKADAAGKLSIAIDVADNPGTYAELIHAVYESQKEAVTKPAKQNGAKNAPTVDQVREYVEERGLLNCDPEAFVDHFTSNGWKVGGKTAMKDWKAAVRNWDRNPVRGNGSVKKGTMKALQNYLGN